MPNESISLRQNLDGKHAEQRAIPKFASFRPNAPSQLQSQEVKASENNGDVPDESRYKFHQRKMGRHRRQGRHEHSLKGEFDRHIQQESTRPSSEPRESTSKPFMIDRVGDPNNLKFGGLHSCSTASYLRFGSGHVVGSPRNQKIDRAGSTEKGLVLSDTRDLPKTKHPRWWLHHEEAREFKVKAQEGHGLAIDSEADFLYLKATQKAKPRHKDAGSYMDSLSSSDEKDTHYRSVNIKPKSMREPVDEDLRYNSDTSSSQGISGRHLLPLDGSAQRKRVQLYGRMDAEPTNLEAWLDLVAYQDELLGLGQDMKRKKLTSAEKYSNSEIKLSIFEKALEKVRDPGGREVLLLGMMQEATRIWEPSRMASQWKVILEQNPRNLRLWTKYLDFMQTNSSHFRYSDCLGAYSDCLNMTNGMRSSPELSAEEQNSVFNIQIYLLLRMTLLMRECGFAEHATATWQAILEFVFFKPIIVPASDHDNEIPSRKPTASMLEMFERFWDNETPRIGEDGAKGWASYSPKQGRPPQPRAQTSNDLNNNNDHWKSWLAAERRHDLLSRNPARTIDDIEENDPYRIVLFSDVRPFLFDPPSIAGDQLILDAFTVFCSLPSFTAEGPTRVWGRDGFLSNDALGVLQDSWRLRFPKGQEHDSIEIEDSQLHVGTADPFQFPIQDYQVSSDSLFAEKQWFSVFHAWQEQCFGGGGPVEVAWVLRSLKMLIGVDAVEEEFVLYVLALELRISPETVRKTAKSMLRKRPYSICLYNAYALIEYRLGNTDKGEDIITTSINMGKNLYEGATIPLWRNWVWETLRTRSAQEAFVRLLAFSKIDLSEKSALANPALLLRSESAFVAIRDRMLSLGSFTQATFAIECLILFAYLRKAQSFPAAILAFKSNIALFSTHISHTSSYHEYLHQSFARLLYYHATHTHIFKPSDFRSLLSDSIAQFPNNTVFLSLYAWNEARFRIDDRLRSVIKELILSGRGGTRNQAQDSVIPHFFAIYSELHRAVTSGSNISTIRSTFERAVESDNGAHCAGLWKLYFLFEHSRHETERAKTIFWRGLRACPWAKDLYMLAFEYLRGEKGMDEADLRGIYELLGERELRVHVRLEDTTPGLSV